VSTACGSAVNLGGINPGRSATYTATLVPGTTSTWVTVTFNDNTNLAYHPHVTLTTNPNSEYVFDIYNTCNGSNPACGTEGGTAVGVTDWETFYTAGDPSHPATFQSIQVGTGGQVWIQVRKVSGPVDCNAFTLTISD
jgi:hypothetical protein